MSEPRQCDDTSSGNIQSSLPASQTPLQGESGKSDKKRQKKPLETGSGEDEQPTRYQPFDLKSLTFNPIGSNQEVDIWHASPQDFHAYVSQFSSGFGKVNIEVWPLAERLAFVNAAWKHFQTIGRPFPFSERQHLAPDVDSGHVPDVDAQSDTSASEAV